MSPGSKKFIVAERLDAAMRAAGYERDRHLALRLGVKQSQIQNWRQHTTTPRAENLVELCLVLNVSPAYLFGIDREPASPREGLLDEIRRSFGRGTAEAVDHLAKLTPHHRAIVAGRIAGWVEALLQQERDEPRPTTQFERDQGLLEDDDLPVSGEPRSERAAPFAEEPSPSRPR